MGVWYEGRNQDDLGTPGNNLGTDWGHRFLAIFIYNLLIIHVYNGGGGGNRTHTAIYEILLEVENAAPKTGDRYHDNGMDKEIIQQIAPVATSQKGLRAS